LTRVKKKRQIKLNTSKLYFSGSFLASVGDGNVDKFLEKTISVNEPNYTFCVQIVYVAKEFVELQIQNETNVLKKEELQVGNSWNTSRLKINLEVGFYTFGIYTYAKSQNFVIRDLDFCQKEGNLAIKLFNTCNFKNFIFDL